VEQSILENNPFKGLTFFLLLLVHSWPQHQPSFSLICITPSCSAYFSALMEAETSFETLVNIYQSTWCDIPEDGIFLVFLATDAIVSYLSPDKYV
jgi:hypothetical protein